MNDIALRPATAADRDFILEACRATMTEYHRTARGWNDAEIEAAYARHVDAPGTQVVLLAGEPVGVLTVVRGPRGDAVSRVAVLPRVQGRGVGTFLLRSILERNAREGRPVRLSVYKCNPAWRLYQRLGFQIVSESDIEYHMVWRPGRQENSPPQTAG
jgi:ribosomal protein S18 acetylase RimI-like enzyme